MCSTPRQRLYICECMIFLYSTYWQRVLIFCSLDVWSPSHKIFFLFWAVDEMWSRLPMKLGVMRPMVGEQYQDRTFTEVCGGVARDSRVGLRDSGRLVYSGRIGTLAHLHRVGVRVTSGSVGALGDPCTLTPLPPSCFIPFQYHSELTPPKCSWVQAWDSPYIIQIKH